MAPPPFEMTLRTKERAGAAIGSGRCVPVPRQNPRVENFCGLPRVIGRNPSFAADRCLGSAGRAAGRADRREAELADNMRKQIAEDELETEDEMARRELGPRGVPGEPDAAKMTPQRQKKLPKAGVFDGHTA